MASGVRRDPLEAERCGEDLDAVVDLVRAERDDAFGRGGFLRRAQPLDGDSGRIQYQTILVGYADRASTATSEGPGRPEVSRQPRGILKIDDVPPPLSTAAPAGLTSPAPPRGQPVIPPHLDGSAPPLPDPDGPPASSMFDTSALTGPGSEEPAAASSSTSAPPIEPDPVRTLELKPQIVEQLSSVFDPEIPVNIYELGLIYDIAVDKQGLAVIQMTLTAPGCPAAVTLPAEVQGKVNGIEGVSDARVDLVWEPPWDKDRMSDAAKLQLGIFD